ncbi:hypothetical protein BS17DRAFT_814963 [Gyrodon lividus]|nr:hypothetical protein BS17DRAFT_814963 [Gyrodon lividus]
MKHLASNAKQSINNISDTDHADDKELAEIAVSKVKHLQCMNDTHTAAFHSKMETITVNKIADYERTADSDAYTMAMYVHFKKYWGADLHADAIQHAEKIFKKHHLDMYGEDGDVASPKKKTQALAFRPGQAQPSLDTFNSTDTHKLHAFIVQCKLNFQDHPCAVQTDHTKVTFAQSCLKGMAVEWFEPDLLHMADLDLSPLYMNDYHKLPLKLQTKFGSHDLVTDAEDQLDNLSMKDSHCINKYVVELNCITSKV